MELDGKVAIVTGGNSGIGRAISEVFAREKARVVIGARNVEKGNQTVEAIQKKGGTATFVRTDLQDSSQVRHLVEEAVARFGTVDIVCHCAGAELVKLLVDTTEDEWDMVMNTNARGAFLVSKYALPYMIARKKERSSISPLSSVSWDSRDSLHTVHQRVRLFSLQRPWRSNTQDMAFESTVSVPARSTLPWSIGNLLTSKTRPSSERR